MKEILEKRKHYFFDYWVYYSTIRKKRPYSFKSKEKINNKKYVKNCPFCLGNETSSNDELGRINKKYQFRYDKEWVIRWISNKYPVLANNEKIYGAYYNKSNELKRKNSSLFKKKDAYGFHEVIIESPFHNKHIDELSLKHIQTLLLVYNNRINELSKKRRIKYISIIKNKGKEGGASQEHCHSQIYAIADIPLLVKLKLEKNKFDCLYCKIIKQELKLKERIVYQNSSFVIIAPYASKLPGEVWILPKRHVKKLNDLSNKEYMDFAECIKKILHRLNHILGITHSYNYFITYSPDKFNLHLHMEIIPRISNFGGYELSSFEGINGLLPEEAVKWYNLK